MKENNRKYCFCVFKGCLEGLSYMQHRWEPSSSNPTKITYHRTNKTKTLSLSRDIYANCEVKNWKRKHVTAVSDTITQTKSRVKLHSTNIRHSYTHTCQYQWTICITLTKLRNRRKKYDRITYISMTPYSRRNREQQQQQPQQQQSKQNEIRKEYTREKWMLSEWRHAHCTNRITDKTYSHQRQSKYISDVQCRHSIRKQN